MKKIIILALFAMFITTTYGFAEEVRLAVKGMVCAFCAQGIKKKFSAEKSVEKVEVDLDKMEVVLNLKEGMNLADEEIRKIIIDAGYALEKVERKVERKK